MSPVAVRTFILGSDGKELPVTLAGKKAGVAVRKKFYGDDILIDRSGCNEALRDGIYVLRVDDSLLVKRLAIHPLGKTVTLVAGDTDLEDPAGAISVSIGTASFPADATTADGLLAAADRSMYVDKRQRVA